MAANRDCDAHLLVAALHRRAMLLCSQAGNRPFQGLSAAGSSLNIDNKWRRRLRIWDAVLGLTEKISPASVEAHLAELQQEVLRAIASTTTEHTRQPSASHDTVPPVSTRQTAQVLTCDDEQSTSSAASWAEGCFDSICEHLEAQQDQGKGDTRRQSHQTDKAAGRPVQRCDSLRHDAEHRARQNFVARMATTLATASPVVEIKMAEAGHIKYPAMLSGQGCLPPSPIAPSMPHHVRAEPVAPPPSLLTSGINLDDEGLGDDDDLPPFLGKPKKRSRGRSRRARTLSC